MAALDVLPLATAKAHLNIPFDNVDSDADLPGIIGAAVERVGRHVGRVLTDPALCSASELLACKVALAYYWIVDRPENGPPPGYVTGGLDDTPGSFLSLKDRLSEILGGEDGGAGAAPGGVFDTSAPPWPDPPRATGTYQPTCDPIYIWR